MKPGKRTGEYRTALKTSESEGGLSIWRISSANEDNPFPEKPKKLSASITQRHSQSHQDDKSTFLGKKRLTFH